MVVLQGEVIQGAMHPEAVPKEGDCIPIHRGEEVMVTKTAGKKIVVVTPGGDTNNRTQTGVSMRGMNGNRSLQELVGSLDQPATQKETER